MISFRLRVRWKLKFTASIYLVRFGAIRREAARDVVGQGVRMIERAGVQPYALGTEDPGVTHGGREQVFSKAADELGGDDSEIGNFHGVVFGHPAQFVPFRQT